MKARALAVLHLAASYTAYVFELVLVVVALLSVVLIAVAIVGVRALARVIDYDVVNATMREMFDLALGPFAPQVVGRLEPEADVMNNADGSVEVAAAQPIRREDYIGTLPPARQAV
jgi:hypothetical protein